MAKEELEKEIREWQKEAQSDANELNKKYNDVVKMLDKELYRIAQPDDSEAVSSSFETI